MTIPVYNSAATLERCIRSAMRQSLRDIEIRVADDGSTDDSAAVADRLAAEDLRVTVIRLLPNQGKPAAMNRLIAAARGEWIAVLDADDAFEDERLARLVTAAERAGVEMVADNILYVDGGADRVVRTAFDPQSGSRTLSRHHLAANSDSYAEFDFGILKPIIRRDFLAANSLTYYEQTRLAEDFYYLMNFFVAGGTGLLLSEPGYFWTMPFGTLSRQWTRTGAGAWRYDYRQALLANQHFIAEMTRLGQTDMLAMLEARSRQYHAMIHYLDAQRLAAEGARLACVGTILGHPATWRLLARRVAGRLRRSLSARDAKAAQGIVFTPHPSLRTQNEG